MPVENAQPGNYIVTVDQRASSKNKTGPTKSGNPKKPRTGSAGKVKLRPTGKLKIGNQWNAISIIALSQHSPLKAIAELVENSLDAGARHITILKARESGQLNLKIIDDGQGVRLNDEGHPDFKYVATHICDSIKRKLKADGETNVQGEFGIGLLGFWILGQSMSMSCPDRNGAVWVMEMEKGKVHYYISQGSALVVTSGTELTIRRLLSGPAQLTGEKISQYLSEELGERIRSIGAEIIVRDKVSRSEEIVQPREFYGSAVAVDMVQKDGLTVDIYFKNHPRNRRVALYKSGTRIIEDISMLEGFDYKPWNSGYFAGRIDVEYIHLSPASRLGVVQDEMLAQLKSHLIPVESALNHHISIFEESVSQKSTSEMRRLVQHAVKETMIALNSDNLMWPGMIPYPESSRTASVMKNEIQDDYMDSAGQKLFFEIAGPLHSVTVSPVSAVMQKFSELEFRVIGRDRQRRWVESFDCVNWEVVEGSVRVLHQEGDKAIIEAPGDSGSARIRVKMIQRGVEKYAEAILTITDYVPRPFNQDIVNDSSSNIVVPDYELEDKATELWRSKYLPGRGIICVNSGHRDYVYASTHRMTIARYIGKLYCKELALIHSQGKSPEQMLEHQVQLEIHLESHLRIR